ncbi:MAG: DUF4845 domain-containing protein [Burkholderiales bacterium]|nr:DUF4845 domain-containing protein [Burkholderiales bacterium]
MSLIGLILMLSLLAMIAIIAARVAPTAVEYFAVKKAVVTAKHAGSTIAEMQAAFNKQADVDYIDSINASDLVFEKSETGYEISFSYTKKIHLFGPANLLLEYEGSTAKSGLPQKK